MRKDRPARGTELRCVHNAGVLNNFSGEKLRKLRRFRHITRETSPSARPFNFVAEVVFPSPPLEERD
jgi:hypothetical protein